jgi:glycosyltransferase involved in cell wall biosynthesis
MTRGRTPLGIDASRALIEQRTGTEHYSASLIRALADLPRARRMPVTLYANLPDEEARGRLEFDLPPRWRIRGIPFPRLWTHARLSREMLTQPPKTLFVPSHVVPIVHPRRTVVTVHDLGYIHYPDAHTQRSRLYLDISTRWSARAARRVIAISEATKRDLVKHYGVPERKISVVYHGRDPLFMPVGDPHEVWKTAAKYGVRVPYCLHVGTIQPRKNLGTLVEAWRRLRDRMEQPPQLLLAGKRGWLYASLLREVEERGLNDLIRFADYVTREDLPALYSGALAFVFPSLYEGFGLPPLEAMSCGTPVLASTASSVPEVVGEAALHLDPHNPGDWASAVELIYGDPAMWEELSRRGLARASRFTWERCARETWEALGFKP